MNKPTTPPSPSPPMDSTPATGVLRIPSQQLFAGGAREIEISHNGCLYRLRQTSMGKLILTK